MSVLQVIEAKIGEVGELLRAHPERRIDLAEQYAATGELRPHPVLYLGRPVDPDAGEGQAQVEAAELSPEERVLDQLRGLAAPLEMRNPIRSSVGLGVGPGTLAASFGIQLNPRTGYQAVGNRSLDDVLRDGMPDPETSGLIPEMREDIQAIRALTPDWLGIVPPDLQGPFNIACMVLGANAFIGMREQPLEFRSFIAIITDFFLELDRNLRSWIGETRYPKSPPSNGRIAECSANLISAEAYVEHVLPHDLRIAENWGQVAVHPCSGPNVFYETIRGLPNVVYTEAGFIDKTCAGCISVDDALSEIDGRDIVLAIGQELAEGLEEETVRCDLDAGLTNPRLLFSYTGMHWRERDDSLIRDMHLRLDDYWYHSVHREA